MAEHLGPITPDELGLDDGPAEWPEITPLEDEEIRRSDWHDYNEHVRKGLGL